MSSFNNYSFADSLKRSVSQELPNIQEKFIPEDSNTHLFKPIAIKPHNPEQFSPPSFSPLSDGNASLKRPPGFPYPSFWGTNTVNNGFNLNGENNNTGIVLGEGKQKCKNKSQNSSGDLGGFTVGNLSCNENKNSGNFKEKICCTCKKTKCVKKYCECYSNKKFCEDCHCQNCLNKPTYYRDSYNDKRPSNDIIICTCSKSSCNKKYCECYKAGVRCNNKCRCLNCQNKSEDNINNYNENINNINSNKTNIMNTNKNNGSFIANNSNCSNLCNNRNNCDEQQKLAKSVSSSSDSSEKFKIQRLSVLINKSQTIINVEKLDKNDMILLGKKRVKIHKENNNENKE